MKVLKFGGTSLKDADAFRRVLNIIEKQNEKIIIVLSASAGITDKLVEINSLLPKNPEKASEIVDSISEHHHKLCNDLNINYNTIFQLCDKLNSIVKSVAEIGLLTNNTSARILGFGEYLTTNILYQYLKDSDKKYTIHDSKEFISKSESGNYLISNLDTILKSNDNGHIFQGFVCKGTKDKNDTLGRGGSDLTAALLAAEAGADSLEIWTDVSGVYTADPRFFEDTKQKRIITYEAMRKMSFFGAKVLHPDTVKPAFEKNIPVRILNTFNEKDQGTTVVHNSNEETKPAIVKKEKCDYYKIIIPDGISSVAVMNRIYNELEILRLKPIYSNYLDNAFICIFDKDTFAKNANFIKNFKFVRNIDLIFICDIGVDKLKLLTRKVEQMEIIHSDVDFENKSILIITDSDKKENFDLNTIHKILVK